MDISLKEMLNLKKTTGTKHLEKPQHYEKTKSTSNWIRQREETQVKGTKIFSIKSQKKISLT